MTPEAFLANLNSEAKDVFLNQDLQHYFARESRTPLSEGLKYRPGILPGYGSPTDENVYFGGFLYGINNDMDFDKVWDFAHNGFFKFEYVDEFVSAWNYNTKPKTNPNDKSKLVGELFGKLRPMEMTFQVEELPNLFKESWMAFAVRHYATMLHNMTLHFGATDRLHRDAWKRLDKMAAERVQEFMKRVT